MKSAARISAWVAFAAILCFSSAAFGQSAIHVSAANNTSIVAISVPAFLTLGFGPGGQGGNNGNQGGQNTCGNQGGNGGQGGNGWGWNWWGGGNNNNNGGGCTTVPEGGTTLMYVSLAGLCCFGAMVFKSHRRAAISAKS